MLILYSPFCNPLERENTVGYESMPKRQDEKSLFRDDAHNTNKTMPTHFKTTTAKLKLRTTLTISEMKPSRKGEDPSVGGRSQWNRLALSGIGLDSIFRIGVDPSGR